MMTTMSTSERNWSKSRSWFFTMAFSVKKGSKDLFLLDQPCHYLIPHLLPGGLRVKLQTRT